MTISSRNFYRLSLVIPILVVVAVMALNYPHRHEDSTPESDLYSVASALLMVSIPYDLIALWLGWWMRDKTETRIRRMFYVMPIVLMAVHYLCWLAFYVFSQWPSPDPKQLYAAMVLAMYGLAGAYAYALAVIGLCLLLRNMGLVRREPQPAV